MTLTRVRLENFTAFAELDLELSSGINVLVGANGTGKTHLLKVCYAACDISKTQQNFRDKLSSVFLPSNHSFARVIRRTHGKAEGSVTVLVKINGSASHLCVTLAGNVSPVHKCIMIG